MLKNQRKDTYQSYGTPSLPKTLFAPLLQVPPASRGEPRTRLFGSPCEQGEP
jgi:hypothetical protein